jgi:hypothetical protein
MPSPVRYTKRYNENELKSHANVGHKKLEQFGFLPPVMLLWQQKPYCSISRDVYNAIPQIFYVNVMYSKGAFYLILCTEAYIT